MPKKAADQSSQRLKAPETAAPPAFAGFDTSRGPDGGTDSDPAASCGQQSGWAQVWPGAEREDFADIMVSLVLSLFDLHLALPQLFAQKAAQAFP